MLRPIALILPFVFSRRSHAPNHKNGNSFLSGRTISPLDQDQWRRRNNAHCFNTLAQVRIPWIGGRRGEGEHRMRAVFRYIWVLVVATAALSGPQAFAADPDHGAVLAKRWCATCHVVDSDQKQASADVPPFAAIAHKPDFTTEKIASFLLEPHPKMPNFPLSRDEAADIAAYIGALRK
jgi:mono/diheme cytochrome c family protein